MSEQYIESKYDATILFAQLWQEEQALVISAVIAIAVLEPALLLEIPPVTSKYYSGRPAFGYFACNVKYYSSRPGSRFLTVANKSAFCLKSIIFSLSFLINDCCIINCAMP